MSLPPPRSLLTPWVTEQLPPYTPRQGPALDPETSSIRSSAPSYVSAAPSYHSSPPQYLEIINASGASPDTPTSSSGNSAASSASTARPGLLSSQRSAPGFRHLGSRSSASRRSSSNFSNASLNSLYNISEWVPAMEGVQARHYHNVARRRATEASTGMNLARSAYPLLASSILEPPTGIGASTSRYPRAGSDVTDRYHTWSPASGSGMNAHARGYSTTGSRNDTVHGEDSLISRSSTRNTLSSPASNNFDNCDLPLSPNEDPDLVGEAAAASFRSQRLYRTYQRQENQAMAEITAQPLPYQPGRPGFFPPLVPPPGQDLQSMSSLSMSPLSESSSPSNSSSSTSSITQGTPTSNRRHHVATSCVPEEALQQESESWDFMLSQMSDWQERERSWNKFKEEVDKRTAASMFQGLRLSFNLGRTRSPPASSSNDDCGTRKLKKNKSTGGLSRKWKSKVNFSLGGG